MQDASNDDDNEFLTRIDGITDDFEAAWRGGKPARIEDYLCFIDEAGRPALLRYLISLEIDLRKMKGESPDAEEYLARFPHANDVVQKAFEEGLSTCGGSPGASSATGESSHEVACESTAPADKGAKAMNPAPFSHSRYEILEFVGRGAMGAVYRAKHRRLEKDVAVKLLLPERSTERFRREARLLAQLKSPHVIEVYDFDDCPDGSTIITMEWIDGKDLGKIIAERKGAIEEQTSLPWMRDVCRGMQAASDRGIIHRDLKPSNILIERVGRARVGDFGLAVGPTGGGDVTDPGVLLGSPHYMAPEQAEDPRGVDVRADVYGFGATFYHVLTGRPPFQAETSFGVLFKHKMEPLTPPRAVEPSISNKLSELIERCMAKSPADRFSSFSEILARLTDDDDESPWDMVGEEGLAPFLSRYRERRGVYLSDVTPAGLLDRHDFPGGRRLSILRGDIVGQDVEAIVSSDDEGLRMRGGVSRAILVAGGPEILAEAKRFTPVRAGRAIVTTAGRLNARFIFPWRHHRFPQ